ncbi:MAG: helix-turn-helix transcriptional regulator [Eubacteriales bacterium]|nr:helix-turn-helix transcriptional regulator [Eubacteriales bacterium]
MIGLEDTINASSTEITTQILLERLRAGQSITEFFKENQEAIFDFPLHECLKEYIAQKQLSHAELIRVSGMNRRYFYDILSGKRHPDQNYVLRLLLALHATVADVQWLLRCARYPSLYVRSRRDAVILYSFEHAMSIKECNKMLENLDLEPI